MALKVLGRVTSINVRKALWSADEMGLAYERQDWGLPIRDPKVPQFLALNPNGQIPVVIDGDFVLWESNAIMLYLAERYGRDTLWTQDPQTRALSYQWLTWQASELPAAWGYALQALLRHTPGYDDSSRIEASIARWSALMGVLEGHLAKGGAYVAGALFTLADIAIGLAVHRWYGTPFEKPSLPAVEAYYQRVKTRPAAVAWMGAGTP